MQQARTMSPSQASCSAFRRSGSGSCCLQLATPPLRRSGSGCLQLAVPPHRHSGSGSLRASRASTPRRVHSRSLLLASGSGFGDASPGRDVSPMRSPRGSAGGQQAESPRSVHNGLSSLAGLCVRGSSFSYPKKRLSQLSSVSSPSAAAAAATGIFEDLGLSPSSRSSTPYDKVRVPPRKVLLLCDGGDGALSQRLRCELQAAGHDVTLLAPKNGAETEAAALRLQPDVILCPSLAKPVPKAVRQRFSTVVVHPGPLGDGGPHSVDRAKRDQEQAWGVTLLEADDSGEATGAVWAHRLASVPTHDPEVTKSVLYRNYLIPLAVDAMWEVLAKQYHGVPPLKVDHSDPSQLFSSHRPSLLPEERAVDFARMTAAEVEHTVASSDSRPGATATFHGMPGEYALFNAWLEEAGAAASAAEGAAPGHVLGQRDGAVLVRCSDGSCVWIRQLLHVETKASSKPACSIKLPAAQVLSQSSPATVLPHLPGPDKATPIPFGTRPRTFQQVYTWQAGPTMYVNFDFYNGAMSTEQCIELRRVLEAIEETPEVRAVVLLGSRAFFSNGINLNTVEAAADPAYESWRNTSALGDVVKAAFSMPGKLVVAALQANAGAGGAMMALAADLVWCQKDVVLNPHYKAMGVRGSEYWTHFLPARVGADMAEKLTNMGQPITAKQAAAIKLCDECIDCPKDEFIRQVRHQMDLLWLTGVAQRLIQKKLTDRTLRWYAAAESCRAAELTLMAESFESPKYAAARRSFVQKKLPGSFPPGGAAAACASPVAPLVAQQDLRVNNVVPAFGLLDEDEDEDGDAGPISDSLSPGSLGSPGALHDSS